MRGREEGGRKGMRERWDRRMKTRSTFYTIMCSYYDFQIVDWQLGTPQHIKLRPQAKLEIMFGTHHR